MHGKYLEQKDIDIISLSLEEEGYKVTIRQNEFPDKIRANTLIYSQSRGLDHKLSQLGETLKRLGFPLVETIPNTSSNHRYTPSNWGLYLIPNGFTSIGTAEEAFDPTVMQEYGSSGCEVEYVLDILPNKTAEIENLSNKESLVTFSMQWSFTGEGKISLSDDSGVFEFEITKKVYDQTDKLLHVTILRPLAEAAEPMGCSFKNSIYELIELN